MHDTKNPNSQKGDSAIKKTKSFFSSFRVFLLPLLVLSLLSYPQSLLLAQTATANLYPNFISFHTGNGNVQNSFYRADINGVYGIHTGRSASDSSGVLIPLEVPASGTTTVTVRILSTTDTACNFYVTRQFTSINTTPSRDGSIYATSTINSNFTYSDFNTNPQFAVGFAVATPGVNLTRQCEVIVTSIMHNGNELLNINPAPITIDFPESLNFQTDAINFSMGMMVFMMAIQTWYVIIRRKSN